jgi:hypothetical protein
VISIADTTVIEGDSGTTDAVFVVSLSYAPIDPVSVDYATADGNAVADSDYLAMSGTLTFAPGATTQTIAVPVLGDTRDENDEAFLVRLQNPVNGRFGDAAAQGVIRDDDGRPSGCSPIAVAPIRILASGVYCLVRDLTTDIQAGVAISIEADNVALSLNRHSLIGTAGTSTQAVGIYTADHRNVRIQQGVVRGFSTGILLAATPPYLTPQGYRVQNVRAEANTYAGIWVEGMANTVSRTTVVRTSGTTALGADVDAYGIVAKGPRALLANNHVEHTYGTGTGAGYGLALVGADKGRVIGNMVHNDGLLETTGVLVESSSGVVVNRNRLSVLSYGVVFANGSTGTYANNWMSGVVTPYVGGTPAP